jgi:lipopolysaccharide transport system ATP-binding protein
MTVIRVENLTKEYRLGIINHGTLRQDVQSWWARMRGKEDPNSIVSHSPASTLELNPRFLALDDISFEVQQGDAIGIIGRNGAGKSTLLKILSRVTAPTCGVVKLKGRVASLLEVGTGFHPELTGRENIFLNGTILGMRRTEIQSKLDEIVAFAEIDQFIDTPVKRYSSGMYVRLAFAVAAHLDPEILIVDEVLSVGDVSFQKKCLGKMENVSKSEGRTILFVSHNLTAIQNFCSKTIYLEKGKLLSQGPTSSIVEHYLTDCLSSTNLVWQGKHEKNDYMVIERVQLVKTSGQGSELYINEEFKIDIDVKVHKYVSDIAFEIFVKTLDGIVVFNSFTDCMNLAEGDAVASCFIPKDLLNNGHLTVTVVVSKNFSYWLIKVDEALTLDMLSNPEGLGWQGDCPGTVRPRLRWDVMKSQSTKDQLLYTNYNTDKMEFNNQTR